MGLYDNLHKCCFLPPENEVWDKVIFSVACVKNSVHGGGSASVHAGIPPPEDTPLRSACWEIRSPSGRYASYWNAILFVLFFW